MEKNGSLLEAEVSQRPDVAKETSSSAEPTGQRHCARRNSSKRYWRRMQESGVEERQQKIGG